MNMKPKITMQCPGGHPVFDKVYQRVGRGIPAASRPVAGAMIQGAPDIYHMRVATRIFSLLSKSSELVDISLTSTQRVALRQDAGAVSTAFHTGVAKLHGWWAELLL